MQTTIQKEVKEEVLPNGDVKLVYDEVNDLFGGLVVFGAGICMLLFVALGAIGIFGQFLLSIVSLLLGAACYFAIKYILGRLKNKYFTITPNSGVSFNEGKDYAKFDDISTVSCDSIGNSFTLRVHVGGGQAHLTGLLPQSVANELFRLFKLHSQREWS